MTSGFLKSVVIDDIKLKEICYEALVSNGDNTETLETIDDFLSGDELNLKEIKEALVLNFLVGLVDFNFYALHKRYHRNINIMFADSDKKKLRKSLL